MTILNKAATLLACAGALSACHRDNAAPATASATGLQNAVYLIDGEPVSLRHGRAKQPATPGSAVMIETTIWENSTVAGDLDGDGDMDYALVLEQDAGNGNAFAYLAAAMQGSTGYEGSEVLFLGERIHHPQVSIQDGIIQVHFMDRGPFGQFNQSPTQEHTVRARLAGRRLDAL
jgi:hypothetical protein